MLIDFLQQILTLHSLNPNYFVFSGHAHSDHLRSTTLGRPPKIHHPSFTGVRMPLAEEVQKEPSGMKIKQMRFDDPPFDPVTRELIANPPQNIRLKSTPLMDDLRMRFPEGWSVTGTLKGTSGYTYTYNSPEGKKYSFGRAVDHCLRNGYSKSDLSSSAGPCLLS